MTRGVELAGKVALVTVEIVPEGRYRKPKAKPAWRPAARKAARKKKK